MTSLGFNKNEGSINVLSWKKLTFKQVVNSIQKNKNDLMKTKLFFGPQPLKIYRRNIGNTTGGSINNANNERNSIKISNVIEQPGGVSYTNVPICSNNGIEIISDKNVPNSNYENGLCINNSCLLIPNNALNRIRSAGMIKKRNYNVNNYQYLQNRDKTFNQNQFNYITEGNNNVKPGSSLALLYNNKYVQNANGQFNVPNNIVIYKPNNSKYAQQGGVCSSSHIERIKLDNIQKVAHSHTTIFGATSNDYRISVTYSGNKGINNGTTFGKKDLYNIPTHRN